MIDTIDWVFDRFKNQLVCKKSEHELWHNF